MNHTMSQRISRAAFTLIELLVVIAIIVVLAALTFAVSGTVRKTTDRTKCLANLRSVGRAISGYTGDKEGVLPGPLWTTQSCWYKGSDLATLGAILAPYLGAPLDWEKRRMEVLVCPAWQRGAPYQEDFSFVMNTEVVVDGTTINPWGDADIDADETASDPTAPGVPKLLARLSDLRLSRVWAIQDLDAQSPVRKVPRGIAPKPVHGDKRNALFFDFHVESIPLDYKYTP